MPSVKERSEANTLSIMYPDVVAVSPGSAFGCGVPGDLFSSICKYDAFNIRQPLLRVTFAARKACTCDSTERLRKRQLRDKRFDRWKFGRVDLFESTGRFYL